MRFNSDAQRKAVFAKMNQFDKTLYIPQGAPYPYPAYDEYRQRKKDEEQKNSDSMLENIGEAGIGAIAGGIVGGMLAKEGSALKIPGYGVVGGAGGGVLGSFLGPLTAVGGAGAGTGAGMFYGLHKTYPLALPGAALGALTFPMVFAHDDKEEKKLFPKLRSDADMFLERQGKIEISPSDNLNNQMSVIYGGDEVFNEVQFREWEAKKAEQELQQAQAGKAKVESDLAVQQQKRDAYLKLATNLGAAYVGAKINVPELPAYNLLLDSGVGSKPQSSQAPLADWLPQLPEGQMMLTEYTPTI